MYIARLRGAKYTFRAAQTFAAPWDSKAKEKRDSCISSTTKNFAACQSDKVPPADGSPDSHKASAGYLPGITAHESTGSPETTKASSGCSDLVPSGSNRFTSVRHLHTEGSDSPERSAD